MRMAQIRWNSGAQMMFSNLRAPEGKEHLVVPAQVEHHRLPLL
jgi:hypothetical protein